MPHGSNGHSVQDRRRKLLLTFYVCAIACALSASFVPHLTEFLTALVTVAVVTTACAVWALLQFLQTNDEREREINYRALTFAFVGTLIFSLAIGFLQSFGFHSVSWLGIPALMIVLWSIGLFLYSWRYR